MTDNCTSRSYGRFCFSALAISAPFFATANAASLNDTGLTQCYNQIDAAVSCSAVVGGDAGINPRQDARYGRDAAALAGQLSKVGAGSAGFDYTKIANNGSALAASASLGTNSTDWACTKDNVTGLVWEVKTTSGLRSNAHTYTWYSIDNATNGGDPGVEGGLTCFPAAPFHCNTLSFVAAVNASGGLCGATDWRLPSLRELRTLVHSGITDPSVASIDAAYFPTTNADYYWTNTTDADNTNRVRMMWFYFGYSGRQGKSALFPAKLVRGAQ